MDLDWTVLGAYIFGIALIYFIARLLLIPLRWLIKLIYNGALGGLMIGVVNLLGAYVDLYLPINPLTALVAGFLGIPGVVLIVLLHYLTTN